ncbi:MAG: molecular chaperone HtpG [Planctomycetota bacterium]
MSTAETIAFQAETRELLQLVIHSLYKQREIFLRELISNASDALDKLRFEALTSPELYEGDERLAIRLEVDPDERTLRVIDSGIGMTREEVAENIGTIARSGTRGFAEALRERGSEGDTPDLIGQFGVGFYSAFMVADEVVLETRRAGQAGGVRWTSAGEGEYTLEDVERPERGTSITLKLRAPDADDGEPQQDFTREWVLRDVVKRYSDFVGYPIEMDVEREEGEGDDKKTVERTETLNSQRPLWTRPKSEIEDSEYADFYRHVSHDWHEPLETIHTKAEGTLEFTALLYVPRERPHDLFDPTRGGSRLNLYVKRVFILADCEELLPPWLRFIRGVVDADDLPLNVSRETLQENRQVRQIQKHLVRKTLDALRSMLSGSRDDYLVFWAAFGPLVKEGIYSDNDSRDELVKLLLAESTAGDELTTLEEYVERMPDGQEEIYVLPAADRAAAERSPHLEGVRSRGFEVLFLVDPIDEFVLQRLTEFDGKKVRSIDKGGLELEEDDEAREAREEKQKALGPLLELVRKELADEIEEVRFSARLTDSPAVLVSAENSLSPQVERMLRETGQDVPEQKRVLELNPGHPLVEKLRDLSADDATFARFSDYCALLHGQALLAEGSALKDPGRFSRLVTDLMV